MMNRTAKLLTPATNYAVVQLPKRAFPGVVFQGDSLHVILQKVSEARRHMAANRDEDALDIITDLETEFSEYLKRFEQACLENKIDLPYNK